MRWIYFTSGMLVGLWTFSVAFGSVPSRVTDDTELYEKLTEIRVPKERDMNLDGQVSHLAAKESRYRERLPVSRKRLAQNRRIMRSRDRTSYSRAGVRRYRSVKKRGGVVSKRATKMRIRRRR